MSHDDYTRHVDPGRAEQTAATAAPPRQGMRSISERRGVRVSLDEATFPTSESLPLEETGDSDVSSATGPRIVLAINVPLNQAVRLNKIGWTADVLSAFAFLTWTLLINSTAVPGYTNEPAALGTMRFPQEIIVPYLGPALIQIQASMVSTAIYHVAVRLSGWRMIHSSLAP